MLTESQKLKLGLFVIGAAVLLIASILVFAGGQLLQSSYQAHTIFTESVQGLEVGAAVKFRGVPIGQVSSIEIHPSSADPAAATAGQTDLRILVRMDIQGQGGLKRRISREDLKGFLDGQMRRGARCQLAFAGITGMKFLQIDYYALAGSPVPAEELPIEGSFFIPSQASLLTGVTMDLTETLAKIANIPFDRIGQDTAVLVKDVARLAASVEALVKDKRVDSMLTSLAETSQTLAKVTARVDTEMLEIRKRVEKGVDQFSAALTEIQGLARDARTQLSEAELAKTLQSARGGLEAAETALKSFGHLRTDMRPILDNLDQALRSFSQLVRYLEEDPSALIRGKRKPEAQHWR